MRKNIAPSTKGMAHIAYPWYSPCDVSDAIFPSTFLRSTIVLATVMNVSLRLPPVSRSVTIECTASSRSGSSTLSELDLLEDRFELAHDRPFRLGHRQLQRLQEREAGLHRIRHQHQHVDQLV